MYRHPLKITYDDIIEGRIRTLLKKLDYVETAMNNPTAFKPEDISYAAFLFTCFDVSNRLRWHIRILENRDYELIKEFRLLEGRKEDYYVPTTTNILAQ